MRIDATCTYCGEHTTIGHTIDRGSCLCKVCTNDDRLTYYHLRWRTMDEAEKLENGFPLNTQEPISSEIFNNKVNRLLDKYEYPNEVTKANETASSIINAVYSALTGVFKDALNNVDSFNEYDFKGLAEAITLILETPTYLYLKDSDTDKDIDKYQNMIMAQDIVENTEHSKEMEIIDFLLETEHDFKQQMKTLFKDFRAYDGLLFGTENLIHNLKVVYEVFDKLTNEELPYALTPMYLIRDALRDPYAVEELLKYNEYLLNVNLDDNTLRALEDTEHVLELIATRKRELTYELGSGPRYLNAIELNSLRDMRDISCGLGGETYKVTAREVANMLNKL